MTAKQTAPDAYSGRSPGLDSLRVFALALITWQHAASVLGAYAETQWRGISPGQTGVAIFCAISGYLAFHTTPRSASEWLARRMIGIFPLYWLVTVIAFALAILGTSKSVTVWLFVSQMLGLGYFTHGWDLVNVVSWFISLILLCYALSFAAMMLGRPAAFWLAVTIFAALIIATRTEVVISRHVLAFALGALYGMQKGKSWLSEFSIVLVGVGIFFDQQFSYAGFGILAICLATNGFVGEPRIIRRMAVYSYEYFLIHGICLVAAMKFINSAPVAISVAILAASICAIFLGNIDKYLQRCFLILKPNNGYS